jgi:hypothetical protein
MCLCKRKANSTQIFLPQLGCKKKQGTSLSLVTQGHQTTKVKFSEVQFHDLSLFIHVLLTFQ